MELAATLIWQTNAGLEFTQLSGRLCERLDQPPLRLLDTGSEDALLKVDGRLLQESDLGDIICYGARFEDIALAAVDRGVVPVTAGRGKKWVRERVRRYRNPGPPIEQLLDTGGWVLITERMTKAGGIVSVRTDITET